jgi:hypothetical protein
MGKYIAITGLLPYTRKYSYTQNGSKGKNPEIYFMSELEEKRIRLEQRKNRLLQEEIKFKVQERKTRTRRLIEIGGLVAKAGLDTLPTNTLYGALLSLSETMHDNEAIKAVWSVKGNKAFNDEEKSRTSVIVKFASEPGPEIRSLIRAQGLRYNRFRGEWYGYYAGDPEDLKSLFAENKLEHEIEIL